MLGTLLRVDHDFANSTLTSITAYRENTLEESTDATIKKELTASLDLLNERATKLKELSLEADRIRARIQSFNQAIEGIRAEATRIKAAEVQERPAEVADELSSSVDRLRRELETMKKVREELGALSLSSADIHAELQKARAAQTN